MAPPTKGRSASGRKKPAYARHNERSNDLLSIGVDVQHTGSVAERDLADELKQMLPAAKKLLKQENEMGLREDINALGDRLEAFQAGSSRHDQAMKALRDFLNSQESEELSAHKTQAETATKEARAMREQRDAVRLVLENVRRRLHGNAEDAELQSSFDPVSEIDTILRGREKLGQDLESMRLSKTQSDESYTALQTKAGDAINRISELEWERDELAAELQVEKRVSTTLILLLAGSRRRLNRQKVTAKEDGEKKDNEIAALQRQKDAANKECKEKDGQVAELQKDRDAATQEGEEKDHQITKLQTERDAATQEGEKKDHQITKLQTERDAAIQEVKKKDGQITKLQTERDAAIQESKKKDHQITKLQTERDAATQEVKKKDDQITKLQTERDAATQEGEKKDDQITKLQNEKQTSTTAMQDAIEKSAGLETALGKAEERARQQEVLKQESQEDFEIWSGVCATISSAQRRAIRYLRSTIEGLHVSKRNSERSLAKTRFLSLARGIAICRLQQQKAHLQSKVTKLWTALHHTRDLVQVRIDNLQAQLRQLAESNSTMERDKTVLHARLKRANSIIAGLIRLRSSALESAERHQSELSATAASFRFVATLAICSSIGVFKLQRLEQQLQAQLFETRNHRDAIMRKFSAASDFILHQQTKDSLRCAAIRELETRLETQSKQLRIRIYILSFALLYSQRKGALQRTELNARIDHLRVSKEAELSAQAEELDELEEDHKMLELDYNSTWFELHTQLDEKQHRIDALEEEAVGDGVVAQAWRDRCNELQKRAEDDLASHRNQLASLRLEKQEVVKCRDALSRQLDVARQGLKNIAAEVGALESLMARVADVLSSEASQSRVFLQDVASDMQRLFEVAKRIDG